ncbi:cytochrome P450 [Mycobacterium sp. 852002-40037_SCH5390672]|uniref:cytochrome P450 n=1 Tax=Mycobacterium sp. 852002-40037_SCH5390672 TaxID=1834089 RepID=UPI000804B837|nr:cytochrome P450 [Mycobacterium sp. 852002-40037_SCH5390672]OBB89972.1 cytochrome [Mycobacterium sp. 852002-40037_SCH5390672]
MGVPEALFPRLPWDPRNPYPYYEHRRKEGNVVWDEDVGAWLVLGYRAARQILSDSGWIHPLSKPSVQAAMDPLGRELVNRNMLFVDGARHARLRASLGDVFAPRNISQLADAVASMADDIVGYVPSGTLFNFMDRIALPLPIAVAAAWLDVDANSLQLLRDQSPPISRMLGEFADATAVAEGVTGLAALLTEFLPIGAHRRQQPGDDLLSFIASDPELELEDVVMTSILLAVAGHETTANMLGTAMFRLLRPNDQGIRLVDGIDSEDPSLVTELLRLDGPVQSTARTASRAHVVEGVEIDVGQPAVVVLAAANRDPTIFEAPEQFRTGRPTPAPLSFSHGAHHCVGAALARLMIEVALRKTLARKPELAGDVVWREAAAIRGLKEVPLVFRS